MGDKTVTISDLRWWRCSWMVFKVCFSCTVVIIVYETDLLLGRVVETLIVVLLQYGNRV